VSKLAGRRASRQSGTWAEKFSKEEALMVVKVAPLLKLQIRGHVIIDFDATRIRTVYNFC